MTYPPWNPPRIRGLICCCFLLLGLYGCCTVDPIPTFTWTDSKTAIDLMAKRAESIKTIEAPRCTIRMTNSNGQTIRLDGVLVSRPPDSLRLRATKFSSLVFDLTLIPDGLWIAKADDLPANQNVDDMFSKTSAQQLGAAWSIVTGRWFKDPALKIDDKGGETFMIRRQVSGSLQFDCIVDRATLTPRQYLLFHGDSKSKSTIYLSEYRQFGDVVFPTLIRAQTGKTAMEFSLDEVSFNQELAPAAFKPPRRAIKQTADN